MLVVAVSMAGSASQRESDDLMVDTVWKSLVNTMSE